MNLSEILPFLTASVQTLESHMAMALALRGITLQHTQDLTATTVATVADVLQRLIDGQVSATSGEDATLRALHDNLAAIVATFETAVAEGAPR
ncbi:hypothetical protein OVA07_14015 [Novosphingobium sp. SL115]|uniref:hypothetical protein n=1 Tax=Novosphingobium sp. SL115 TaxID=2995150 RepID=UPI002274A8D2|nr:hypothetical protein [Novosphingobium sp. SL115]MCY1672119.1 hypothetical protein [Novosphingobium sp. SL115]